MGFWGLEEQGSGLEEQRSSSVVVEGEEAKLNRSRFLFDRTKSSPMDLSSMPVWTKYPHQLQTMLKLSSMQSI